MLQILWVESVLQHSKSKIRHFIVNIFGMFNIASYTHFEVVWIFQEVWFILLLMTSEVRTRLVTGLITKWWRVGLNGHKMAVRMTSVKTFQKSKKHFTELCETQNNLYIDWVIWILKIGFIVQILWIKWNLWMNGWPTFKYEGHQLLSSKPKAAFRCSLIWAADKELCLIIDIGYICNFGCAINCYEM